MGVVSALRPRGESNHSKKRSCCEVTILGSPQLIFRPKGEDANPPA